ncbi:hypothetical protein AGMMS49942_06880 [Spirochaetia bacterium]|nr:hypothetical protein AGMMS49942_06880 [Spirochaetia bacterium]
MGRTIISEDGKFEWDEDKDKKNRRLHKIALEQAKPVFDDADRLEVRDEIHSTIEETRYQVLGLSGTDVLFVVDTERAFGERIRIISVRYATKYEKEQYDDSKYAKYR